MRGFLKISLQLFIMPPKARTTELRATEIDFFAIDLGSFQLQSRRAFEDLVALTNKRHLPSSFGSLSDHAFLDTHFKKRVQELVADRSNSLALRATGAAYLWRHFRDIESRSLLENLRQAWATSRRCESSSRL